MLNELYRASRTLQDHGLLDVWSSHGDVHKMSNSTCLYVCLDKDGLPCTARFLDKNQSGKLWVHSKGNFNFFPSFHECTPLLAEEQSKKFDKAAWDKADVEEKRNLLNQLDFCAVNTECNSIYLQDWTLEQMKPVIQFWEEDQHEGVSEPDLLDCFQDLEALYLLLKRYPTQADASFCTALAEVIKNKISGFSKAELNECMKLLVGVYDGKTGGYRADTRYYFDIQEQEKMPCPVASSRTKEALIRVLNLGVQSKHTSEEGKLGVSPLSGKRVSIVDGKYPELPLPLLGKTSIYSNNTEPLPCYTRYQLNKLQAYSAGFEEARCMANTLSFLTDKSRRDKTWTSFPSLSGATTPLLLLVWLEDSPRMEEKMALAFGEDGKEDMYDEICVSVLNLLERKSQTEPMVPVHIQLYKTLDKGRKQIVYSQTLTVSQVAEDLSEWLEAVRNLPPIRWNEKQRKVKPGEEPKKIKRYSETASPGSICRLLRTSYTRGVREKPGQFYDCRSGRFTYQQMYQLYLPHTQPSANPKKLAQLFLTQAVRITSGLISDAVKFQITCASQPFSAVQMRDVHTAVSLLGLLLYKMGIRKEIYMNSQPFYIGRLLKLADLLHRNYCIIERNKETPDKARKPLPGQLMGNAVFQQALANPVAALNRLSEKIPLYIGWAQTTPESQSKWIIRCFEKTAAHMSDCGQPLPEKMTAEEKAQLLLGYLAEISREDKTESNETTEQEDKQNG